METPLAIMLVDRSACDRATYRSWLERNIWHSYTFLEAECEEAAFKLCQQKMPDVILLNAQLDNLNGLEFLSQVKKLLFSSAAVIVLAESEDVSAAVQFIKYGAQDYVVKNTLTPETLNRLVHSSAVHARLQCQREQQQKQEHRINQIALQLHQFLELQTILNTVVSEVQQFLQADRVLIYQLASDRTGTVAAESILEGWTPTIGKHIIDTCLQRGDGWHYQTGHWWAIDDIDAANLTDCHRALLKQFEVKANLALPILVKREAKLASVQDEQQDTKLWGLLIVHQCSRSRQWEPIELELLSQLTAQLAVAIDRAEIFQQSELHHDELLENALRNSEAMNRAIRNALPDLTIRMRRDGTYLDFIAAKTFPIIQPQPNMIGVNLLDLVPSEIASERLQYAERALETGEPQCYEYEIEVEGKLYWQEARLVPSGDDEVLVVIRSIDQKKLAEQARAASEAHLKAIVQHSFDVIAIIEPDGVRRFVSPSVERILGYTPDELMGKSSFDHIHPDDLAQVEAAFSNSIHQPEIPIFVDFRFCHRDGYWVDLELVGTNLLNQPEIHGIVVNLRDVSSRKQTEANLRESEQRFAILAEAAPVGIFRNDVDGNCIYVNEKWCEISGLSIQESMGYDWLQSVHPEEREAIGVLATEIIRLQTVNEHEKRLLRSDGTVRWVYCQVVPERDDFGNVTGYLGTATDITALKQIEAALRQSEARFKAFMDNSPAVSLITDADGRIVFVNPTFLSSVRSLTDHALEKSVFDVFPDEIAQKFHQNNLQVLETQQALQTIEKVPKQDGTIGDFLIYKFPLPDEADKSLIGEVAIDITERVAAEKALQQLNRELEIRVAQRTEALSTSEAKLQAVFSQAAVGLNLTSLSGDYLKVNQKFCEIVGYPEEDLLQSNFMVLTLAADQKRSRDARERLLAGEIDSFVDEKRYIRKDGSLIWVNITVSLVRQLDGKPDYTVCVVEDISHRKRAELELLQNQDLQQAIFNESADAIFLVDTQTLLTTDCNRRAIELFEASSKAELINIEGQTLQRRQFTPEELVAITTEIEQRGAWNREIEYITKKGNTFWGDLVAKQITVAGKNMNLVQVIDITDRKQAEFAQQLQMERELLLAAITHRIRESLDLSTILNAAVEETQQLLQADRVLVYRLSENGQGKVIAEVANQQWTSILGNVFPIETFPPECYPRYLGGQIVAITDRNQGNIVPCLVKFMEKLQIQAKLVAPIVQKDHLWGLLIAHQCSAPRQWRSWEIALMRQIGNQLAIATQQSELYQRLQQELNEREQTQGQLQEANHQLLLAYGELARANRHKDEFLANMSHELRTPLNAILGMAEGLMEGVCGSLNERQKKAIATIDRSGSHLLELINDILDLAKIEAGKLELNLTKVPIKSLGDSSLIFVKQMAAKKNIQLTARIQTEIGNLQADNRRLQQVLINLLSNAVKFTPEGGQVTLEVTASTDAPAVTGKVPPPHVIFSVIDTGIGIAQESLDKVFQPFMQIDSALNRQYTGTGLGLTLVRRIVEMHHGSVTVESKVGQGSRFTVTLPRRQLTLIHSESPMRVGLAQTSSHSDFMLEASMEQPAKQPLILLADDNESNIEMLSDYLVYDGYRIIVAKNGAQAIQIAQEQQPDLILMDIQMPGVDGLEAIRRMRADEALATVPIIALTALAMTGDREQCLRAGANAYIAKPVRLNQLVENIKQILR